MKKSILIICVFFFVSTLTGTGQKFNITIGESSILFKNFNKNKLFFHGVSLNYSYFFKRFGWSLDFNYYLPKSYYGIITHRDMITDEIDSQTPVYVKGGGVSIGPGFTYKAFVSSTQKLTLMPDIHIMYFHHSGNYDTEPFVRLYGGYDLISVNFLNVALGLKMIGKVKNLPISIKLSRYIKVSKSIWNDFEPSGFTEIKLGITFPIVYGPPSSTITKINY